MRTLLGRASRLAVVFIIGVVVLLIWDYRRLRRLRLVLLLMFLLHLNLRRTHGYPDP
jgi:hypothetical protein